MSRTYNMSPDTRSTSAPVSAGGAAVSMQPDGKPTVTKTMTQAQVSAGGAAVSMQPDGKHTVTKTQ